MIFEGFSQTFLLSSAVSRAPGSKSRRKCLTNMSASKRTRPVASKQFSRSELKEGHADLISIKKEAETEEELQQQITEPTGVNCFVNTKEHVGLTLFVG